MKRTATAAIILAASLALASCGSTTTTKDTDTKPAASATTSAGIVLGNYKGKNLKATRNTLEAAGVKVTAKADTDKTILAESNWTITAQDPAAGKTSSTITLTATKPETTAAAKPTPAPGEATSLGLTGTYAQAACNSYGKKEFPYGFKAHWIIDKLADEVKDDRYFLKVKADVTNAFNAKEKGVNIECFVTGTNDAPVVDEFNAY